MLAKQLIKENIEAKNPCLDLGNCGLDGSESILQMLTECEHIETISFSSYWAEYNFETNSFNHPKMSKNLINSQNHCGVNCLTQIPSCLPKNLKKLILSKQKISDISTINYLRDLIYLDLGHNQISDISYLCSLTKLAYLHCNCNKISNISALINLTDIAYLGMGSNDLTNIFSLKNLSNLSFLDLSKNNISDISAVQNLFNLEVLNIAENSISDISALKELKKLTYLNLDYNHISNVLDLSNLSSLMHLYIGFNVISDISLDFLNSLSRLEYLCLLNNPLSLIPPKIYENDNCIVDIRAYLMLK